MENKFGFVTFKNNVVTFYKGCDADLVNILSMYNGEKVLGKVYSYEQAVNLINKVNNKGVDINSKLIAKKQASHYFI